MISWLKKLAPWAICIAIFVYIFTSVTTPAEAWAALKIANIPLFLFYAITYFFIIHYLDTYSIHHFISRFVTPVTFKETSVVRGVSYIIMIINYHAAQGAYAVYFKKTHGAPIAKTLGTLAFISSMDLMLVFSCAVLALGFSDITYSGYDIKATIYSLVPFVYTGYILWILIWKNTNHPLVNKIKKYRIISWVLEHNMFLIFREAKLTDYMVLCLQRLPITVLALGAYNLSVYSFQAEIPWDKMFLYNPIVMLCSSLPITPSGIGIGQILTIEFFRGSITSPLFALGTTSKESLLLMSNLIWAIANQIIKALFGVYSLSRTSKALFLSNNKT